MSNTVFEPCKAIKLDPINTRYVLASPAIKGLNLMVRISVCVPKVSTDWQPSLSIIESAYRYG